MRKPRESHQPIPPSIDTREGLTPGQKSFLDYLHNYTAVHGYAPSQREIAKGLGLSSVGTVQRYKVLLEKKGYLKSSESFRGLTVLGEGPAQSEEENSSPPQAYAETLPLVGRVAAGRPIEAVHSEDFVEVPKSFVGRGQHFVLTVKGDSMIEDGIFEGDQVIIKKQANADNGQTVVALINNEATIKRYYARSKSGHKRIELHPANPHYPIIEVSEDAHFKIEGILVGLMRVVK